MGFLFLLLLQTPPPPPQLFGAPGVGVVSDQAFSILRCFFFLPTVPAQKNRWDHLAAAAPMLLSMSLAGLPFVGADVGGFFGDPSAELFLRWMQVCLRVGRCACLSVCLCCLC